MLVLRLIAWCRELARRMSAQLANDECTAHVHTSKTGRRFVQLDALDQRQPVQHGVFKLLIMMLLLPRYEGPRVPVQFHKTVTMLKSKERPPFCLH
jgi:hypothetical protein